MKIRAAVLEAIGVLRPYVDSRPLAISELELEAPGPGELLVKSHAAGLCHSDLSVIDGNRPRPVRYQGLSSPSDSSQSRAIM